MMTQKIKLEDKEYEIMVGDIAKATLSSLQLLLTDCKNLIICKQSFSGQNSYFESLKTEILSDKAGLIFHDD